MTTLTKEEQEFVNKVAELLLYARFAAIGDDEEGLPEHKRSGYAERMCERADDERKRRREEG